MNIEEVKALAKGDVVFVDCGGSWDCNALINGGEHRIEPRTVVKVNAKTVATNGGSYRPEQLISLADADAAKAAFVERKAAAAAVERRIKAAVERATSAGLRAQYYSGALTISAAGVDKIEELAETIVTANRGMQLAAEIGRGHGPTDAPVVTLHLSVAQAQRVLAAIGPMRAAVCIDCGGTGSKRPNVGSTILYPPGTHCDKCGGSGAVIVEGDDK